MDEDKNDKKLRLKRFLVQKISLLRPKIDENEERSGNDRTGASEQNGPFSSSVMARPALPVEYLYCNSLML